MHFFWGSDYLFLNPQIAMKTDVNEGNSAKEFRRFSACFMIGLRCLLRVCSIRGQT
jgi:hypothetical protein